MTPRRPFLVAAAASALFFAASIRAQETDPTPALPQVPDTAAVETIVCVRHAEKPPDDKGQLTCQGLNRALKLPEMLISHYGKPDFIFAPSTVRRATKDNTGFPYVRPLATIEPTAILVDLPVETRFTFDEIASLEEEVSGAPYRRATIFIAWEHHRLDEMVRHFMVSFGGDPHQVPEWPAEDFDSIFVLRIRTDHGKRTISFSHEQEGLNGQPTYCP